MGGPQTPPFVPSTSKHFPSNYLLHILGKPWDLPYQKILDPPLGKGHFRDPLAIEATRSIATLIDL